MSPDDLARVDRSWSELRRGRDALVDRLATTLEALGAGDGAAVRARWLVDAVDDLVGLLPAPSQLGLCARQLATTWPLPGEAPSFRVDGRAWMLAARDVSPAWTARTEHGWRQAWLLLSEVLAEESLSPFAVHGPVDGGVYVRAAAEDT